MNAPLFCALFGLSLTAVQACTSLSSTKKATNTAVRGDESNWVRFAERKAFFVSKSHVQGSLYSAGWLGPQDFYAYEGGGLSVLSDPHVLDCSFYVRNKCCWHNVGLNSDELDWAVANRSLPAGKAQEIFGNNYAPRPPFLVTGSPKTYQWYQALLVSCPIVCQSNDGLLTATYWLTEGVTLDVCTLPVGSTQYSGNCVTCTESGSCTATIPPSDEPFYIVLVASQFLSDKGAYGGGIAVLDDITYQGAQFCTPSAKKK